MSRSKSAEVFSFLTREAILSADDLTREEVAVPEWGGKVLVTTLSAGERAKFEKDQIELKRNRMTVNEEYFVTLPARLAARTIVDPQGTRLFSDMDVALLGQKSGSALERVVSVAKRLCGMTDADIEELEKNSEATPSNDSSSA